MGTIYLLRHGKTPYGTQNRILGHLNVPISDESRAIIAQLAQRLLTLEPQWEAIYASDLSRAQQTGEVIRMILDGNIPLHVTTVLRDADFGVLTGMQEDAIRRAHPRFKRDVRFVHPGGESYAEMYARLIPFLEELTHKHASAIVVTHPGCIRAAWTHFGGEPHEKHLAMPVPENAVLRCASESGLLQREFITL